MFNSANAAAVKKLLVKAYELIARPGGWIKGSAVKQIKPDFYAYCASGALDAACGMVSASSTDKMAATKRIQDILEERSGQRDIVSWNDATKREQEHVMEVFQIAAGIDS